MTTELWGEMDAASGDGSLRPETKADAAYRELRRRIVDATLTPGSRLDQEMLAGALGVSTTPLREALRRLEAERLVERAAHRQVVIAPLSARELHELYQVRLQLDSLSVELAAASGGPALVGAAEQHLTAPDPAHPHHGLDLNRAFHRTLYSASGNAVLTEILDALWDRTDRYRILLTADPSDAEVAAAEHRELLDLVGAGRSAEAGGLMRRHLQRSVDRLTRLVSDGLERSDRHT
ncbi:MAG TPA: GntR family transcriptional regulator [Acidimicrobiales bacterium]|nr:GntR family transcriptional regulator [Acidimicrobiales bacterium]